MKIRKPTHAFTMVELLTVIAIIGVLAGLFLPVTARMHMHADDAKCTSNLRQLATGIILYASDHDSALPGPVYYAQYAWWQGNRTPFSIAFYLQNYDGLGAKFTSEKDVFLCPAYVKALGESKLLNSVPVLIINTRVKMRDVLDAQPPFGYPNSVISGTADQMPMRLGDLANIVDENGNAAASRTWALKDLDQIEVLTRSSVFWNQLPKNMVHGDHRNALFYDFHVGRVDASNKPL